MGLMDFQFWKEHERTMLRFAVSVFIHPIGPRTSCQVTNLLGLLKHFECCDHFVGKVVNIDLYRRPYLIISPASTCYGPMIPMAAELRSVMLQ